ncbi:MULTISPECIES: NnrS family protein [Cupriavidus]|uniref:Short-chain dehydrogenase n=1 Tax=Cupriavidus metallidurans TaxID=119219 RepID=A0A482J2M1_9BURK|nr:MULTISPECIES: NnrS family protein [Cupriavidus]KWR85674.1 short-chain dehydrogenase [Cupriavidus sp. SHE]QBP13260.1 short-chain dehydrogenase [Cupriavidus metallidurans]QWC91065.1 NnrS family protein [Cupriavidus metallidurans]
MSVLLQISPPSRSQAGYRGLPVLALGFRPFYLLAAAFGALAVVAWVAMYLGWWTPASQPWAGTMVWHAHEMVFGFSAAVVVGFLFTAGKNWTGLQTPQGAWLGTLVGVWLLARVLMWSGPAWAAITVDVLFLPLCSLSFYRILRRAKSQRNYGLAIALGVMGAFNLGFHAAVLSGRIDWALQASEAAIGLVAIFVTVIGGRVIPMFTANAIPGIRIRRWAWVERCVIPLTLLAALASAVVAPAIILAPLALAAAFAQGVRLAGWDSLRTIRKPIVSILHAAYAFLPIGFLLIAAASLGWVDRSTALHALTVGVIGGAIIAMVTRTALGHSGRRLETGRMEHLAYLCMALAAIVRVAGPIALPALKPEAVAASGILWALSLVLYLVKYTPYLTRARIDGKEG